MSEFRPSRRALTRGTAWAVPVVVVGAQAPAFAASCAPLAAPTFTSGKVQGNGTITGGYACWGPGEGSGSDGCTGATAPRRYWVFSDGFQNADFLNCSNYNVWHATQQYRSSVSGRDLGPRTYTFTGSIITNFGNYNYQAAYGAGVALQTSTDGTNWTTKAVYVTRDANDTNQMSFSNYRTCGFAAGFTTPIKLAPPTDSVCRQTRQWANADYRFTVTVPSPTTTIYFRRLHFVAPRTNASLCGSTSASDDVAVGDATITCA